ncbi:MAG: hypothetical protein IIC74_03735 [Bacteroidetes bacterium]|nr:hypothetical protein [Bacteroidota bacterium]
MGTTMNQIIAAFRTYNSQILSDKNIKNLSDKTFSDTLSDDIERNNSVSIKAETDKGINKNRIKHSTTDENKVVVQVIRDESGKIIRTIPLNEQHTLDIFE